MIFSILLSLFLWLVYRNITDYCLDLNYIPFFIFSLSLYLSWILVRIYCYIFKTQSDICVCVCVCVCVCDGILNLAYFCLNNISAQYVNHT